MNKPLPGKHSAPVHDERLAAGFRTGMVAGVLAALAVAGILAGVTVLFQPAGVDGATMQARLAALQARADRGQADVQALRGQLAASDADLAVERAARRALEDNVAALQVQAGQLRDRLAFYDQLFPAGPAGTLSIRAAEITRVPAGLRYRVLLMRSARPGLAPFVGSLQFVATGMRDGVEVRLPLAPLQTVAGPASTGADTAHVATETPSSVASKTVTGDAAGQAAKTVTGVPPGDPAGSAAGGPSALVPLEVNQYRNSEGILELPPGFTPTEVAVEVVRDGTVQTTQQVAVAF